MNKTILVTGGAGFIGSAVIRHLLEDSDYQVINIDKMTYAANPLTIETFDSHDNYHFEQADIIDNDAMKALFQKYQPEGIMHLAAESHVDRSIDSAGEFIQTNIIGTFVLLEQARDYFQTLTDDDKARFRFHHISTDEVYGSLSDDDDMFTETTRYKPNSPYSASKASSDHLVRSWYKTYGLPVVLSNCSNNYGPYQFPEKLIPLIIGRALDKNSLPIYGDGSNIRDWLYVDDHAKALWQIFQNGRLGENYNVGGHNEIRNIDVVQHICDLLDEMQPRDDKKSYRDQIEYVKDRPGHDYRYAIDSTKIKDELSWVPEETFETGIRKTVQWYLDNTVWCEEAEKCYQGDRQGNV